MKERALTAEWAVSVANDKAEDARLDAEHVVERAAEQAANVAEEAKELAERDAEYRLDELTSALEATVDEAQRHWDAGLTEAERLAAWVEHWQDFDQPVIDAMEAHARWIEEIRAIRRARTAAIE